MLAFLISLTSLSFAHEEMVEGEYYTLLDENKKVIHYSALRVHVGDEYINPDNDRYKVVELDGNKAKCKYVGREMMPNIKAPKSAWGINFKNPLVPVTKGEDKTIGVYVTHSDESYIPGDGMESISGEGGIYDVANAFAERLKAHGFKVVFSDNNHNPHDIYAYDRSRKTASTLLKDNPVAIFDVHRDAIPANMYSSNVKGKDVTKIKLVVGRTNPNSNSNLEFAKKIKVAMDEKKAGLSNGIFLGKGDYNQDLSPRAMLIEVGAHENDKEAAIEGAKQFADVIPIVVGATETNKNTGENKNAATTIVFILLILAFAIASFYFINKGPSNG